LGSQRLPLLERLVLPQLDALFVLLVASDLLKPEEVLVRLVLELYFFVFPLIALSFGFAVR
jgi:hypothetical protein